MIICPVSFPPVSRLRVHGPLSDLDSGPIDTPMLQRDLTGMNIEEADSFLARVRRANALGRIGSAEEVGDAVVFLASSASSYITASDLVVDGGFTAVKSF